MALPSSPFGGLLAGLGRSYPGQVFPVQSLGGFGAATFTQCADTTAGDTVHINVPRRELTAHRDLSRDAWVFESPGKEPITINNQYYGRLDAEQCAQEKMELLWHNWGDPKVTVEQVFKAMANETPPKTRRNIPYAHQKPGDYTPHGWLEERIDEVVKAGKL